MKAIADSLLTIFNVRNTKGRIEVFAICASFFLFILFQVYYY